MVRRTLKSLTAWNLPRDPMFDVLEPRMMLATVVWDGDAGNMDWHTPLNWSANAVPTAADDVIIPEDAQTEVWIATTTAAVRSLNVGGVLRLSRVLSISGGATIDGELLLSSVGRLSLVGTEDRSFDGTGTIVMNASSGNPDIFDVNSFVLTIGPELTIRGAGLIRKNQTGAGAIVNYGTISADEAGRTLEILTNSANGFINYGRLESPAGVLRLSTFGAGTIRLEETSQLVSIGGRLELAGVLDNTDRTLVLQDSDGVLTLSGATILGGIVTATGDGGLEVRSLGMSTHLNGVSLDAPVTVVGGASIEVEDGLVLTSTIRFPAGTGSSGVYFRGGAQTISGDGQFVFETPLMVQAHFFTASSSALTIGPEITIRGGGVGISSSQPIVNYGTISADLANGSISASSSSAEGFQNRGRLMSPGGTLSLGGTIFLEPEGSWSSLGGTLLIRGVLVNAGRELLLDATTGPLRVGGSSSVPARISGGTITSVDGTGVFVSNSDTALFEGGVVLNAPVVVRGNGVLAIRGGLMLASTITLGDGTSQGSMVFQVSGAQALSGAGEIVFDFAGSAMPYLRADAATVTIGSGIVIRGGRGAIENLNNGRFINLGTIVADAPGRLLQIRSTTPAGWTNRGALRSAGGELDLFTSGTGTIGLETGTSVVNDGGELVINGAIANAGHMLALSGLHPTLRMNSGKVMGGTIGGAGGATLVASGNFEFDGVTLEVPLLLAGTGGNARLLTIRNNLVLHSTITIGAGAEVGAMNFVAPNVSTLSGSGQVVFDSSASGTSNQIATATGVSLVIHQDVTLRGGNGRILAHSGLALHGEVVADVPGRTLSLACALTTATITNSGILRVSGGTLAISTSPWQNNGIIILAAGALSLGGTFSQVGVGTVERTGGEINIVGTLIGDLILSDETGTWNLAGGTISSGVVAATGSATMVITENSTLDSVTLNIPLVVAGTPMRIVTVRGGLIANAEVTLGAADGRTGQLRFAATSPQTLGGSGPIVFHPDGVEGNSLAATGGVRLFIGPDMVVRGGQGLISSQFSSVMVVNRGTILAESSGRSIAVVSPGGFLNEGVLIAENGGSFAVTASFVNAGTARIGPGSSMNLVGTFEQIAGALLHIGIAGITNALMGRLVVSGSAALGGSFELTYENGFAASRGEEFRVISSAGTTGAFSSITAPPPPAGNLKAPVLVDAQGVRHLVTHIADWDNDLAVTVPDIFSFLTAWFAGDAAAQQFGGSPGVPAIFAFLTAWFAA